MSLGYNRVGHIQNSDVPHEDRAIVIDMRHTGGHVFKLLGAFENACEATVCLAFNSKKSGA